MEEVYAFTGFLASICTILLFLGTTLYAFATGLWRLPDFIDCKCEPQEKGII
jgi:hypothetical protein